MSDLILVQALSDAGITPSSSKTYTLSAIQAALTNLHDGASVYLGCSSGVLNEVWYFFNVAGNAIDGQYQAVDTRK
jgi:ribonuclease T2